MEENNNNFRNSINIDSSIRENISNIGKITDPPSNNNLAEYNCNGKS